MSKVIVIGGGASGMVSAIVAARRGGNVTILERNGSLGKKILVTGNGKCNYFNDDFDVKHYNSNNIDILSNIINDNNKKRVLYFFESIGVVPNIKNGYYYPYSNQAVSILNSLLIEINKLNIRVINNYLVNNIAKRDNKYIINDEYSCDKVIVSAGSYSYYNYDVNSYNLIKDVDVIKPLPALVQLVINDNITKKWAGVRIYSNVKLYEDNKFIREENGEVMFTNYGVSGICIMQLSGIIARGIDNDKRYSLVFNFVPDICDNVSDMVKYLDSYDKKCSKRKVIEIFDNLINYKLGNILASDYLDKYYCELNDKEKIDVVSKLVSYIVMVNDTKGYKESQVCSGGVSLDSININTMEVINSPGLYVTGELLDVNGDCGGYNLGFAWLSGIIAGSSVGDNDD